MTTKKEDFMGDAFKKEAEKQAEALRARKEKRAQQDAARATTIADILSSASMKIDYHEFNWLQITGVSVKLTKREDYFAVVTGARIVWAEDGTGESLVVYSNMAQGSTLGEALTNVAGNLANGRDWKLDEYAARALSKMWEVPLNERHRKDQR